MNLFSSSKSLCVQCDNIEVIGENGAVGGCGEIDGPGLIDDNEIGEDSDDETAMEFVPWGDILPIGRKRKWKRSEHNLTDEQNMEDLVN